MRWVRELREDVGVAGFEDLGVEDMVGLVLCGLRVDGGEELLREVEFGHFCFLLRRAAVVLDEVGNAG